MLKSWDDIEIGAETGHISLTVTDSLIDDYLEAIEMDRRALDGLGDGDARRIAPVDLIPKLAMRTLFIEYVFENLGPSVRAKQAYTFLKPMRAGMQVSATGRIADKYEKRGKRFVSFEATYQDAADGTPLLIDHRTLVVLGENFQMRS